MSEIHVRNNSSCIPARTQGWFVLGEISARHSVDAHFHVFHARVEEADGDELLPCFAGGKPAEAVLGPLELLG